MLKKINQRKRNKNNFPKKKRFLTSVFGQYIHPGMLEVLLMKILRNIRENASFTSKYIFLRRISLKSNLESLFNKVVSLGLQFY